MQMEAKERRAPVRALLASTSGFLNCWSRPREETAALVRTRLSPPHLRSDGNALRRRCSQWSHVSSNAPVLIGTVGCATPGSEPFNEELEMRRRGRPQRSSDDLVSTGNPIIKRADISQEMNVLLSQQRAEGTSLVYYKTAKLSLPHVHGKVSKEGLETGSEVMFMLRFLQ